MLGRAGVGKSRLTRSSSPDRAPTRGCWRGRCLPYGEGITFWPVAEVLRMQPASRVTGDRPAEMLDLADEALTRDGRRGGRGRLIGLAVGRRRGEETFWAVRKLFDGLGRRRSAGRRLRRHPLGRADVPRSARISRDGWTDAPVLLVCLARPELLEVRGWAGMAAKANASRSSRCAADGFRDRAASSAPARRCGARRPSLGPRSPRPRRERALRRRSPADARSTTAFCCDGRDAGP